MSLKRTPIRRFKALRTKRPSLRRVAHSTKPPTAADLQRFEVMREIGCLACLMNRERGIATATFGKRWLEIHHQLSGGRRIGHHATVCLCHYHHQGKRLPFTTAGYTEQAAVFGPSFEREPRLFRAMYGDDQTLLAHQEALLAHRAAERARMVECAV